MNCDQVQAELSEYLEKSLDSGTFKDVEEHLASCPRCREEAEQLARCLRQVANLATVDPPPGFTERVMAQVREIESKPSLWQRLVFPLSIKLPIHATAVVLISVLGIYLFRQAPPTEEARLSTQQAFGILAKKKEAGLSGSQQEIDRAAAKNEPATETTSSHIQVPASEPRSKTAGETAELRASAEQSTAFQDRQRLEEKPTIAVPKKSNLGADEASGAGAKSPAEKPRAGAAPVAPEIKGRDAAPDSAASKPGSPDAMSGSRTASDPAAVDLRRQLQAASDVELVVRRARPSSPQRRDSLGALDKSAERESLPLREAPELRAPLLPAIPESAKPQDMWLTITRSQYDQLRKELLALGSIEAETWLSPREKDSAFRAGERLRVKVTVLPPEPESRPRALPSER